MYIFLSKINFKSTVKAPDDGDHDNYETTKAHCNLTRESRDRARREYDEARESWSSFKTKASSWADFTNRIHRSSEEETLVNEV